MTPYVLVNNGYAIPISGTCTLPSIGFLYRINSAIPVGLTLGSGANNAITGEWQTAVFVSVTPAYLGESACTTHVIT